MVRLAPKTRTCRECGAVLTSHKATTTRCATCREKAKRPTKLCPDCGVPVVNNDQRSVRCRACWKAQHPDRFCVTCNVRLPVNSHRDRKYCPDCWKAMRTTHVCAACGKGLSQGSRGVNCWACWVLIKGQESGGKGCAKEGCDRPHQAKGWCMTHYRTVHLKATRAPTEDAYSKLWVGSHPCQLCGYDKMRSDVHRIVPGKDGGTYELGNMTALCSRCHNEVHRGLTACPEPLYPENWH